MYSTANVAYGGQTIDGFRRGFGGIGQDIENFLWGMRRRPVPATVFEPGIEVYEPYEPGIGYFEPPSPPILEPRIGGFGPEVIVIAPWTPQFGLAYQQFLGLGFGGFGGYCGF